MAYVLRDRVQETTTTTGTGALTLAGTMAGFRSFGATMSTGDTATVCIVDAIAGTWEVCGVTMQAGGTLTRGTPEASSNGGAAVNLAGNAGTTVFMTASAAFLAGLQSPATAAQFVASFLDVSRNSSQYVNSSSFTTILCNIVGTDVGGNYNTATGVYTVPITGTYQLVSKMRWGDTPFDGGPSSGQSYGQAVHTSNADGPWFSWYVTAPIRHSSLNIRVSRFTAGQALRLYCYADGFSNSVNSASLNINLLSVG